jgi:hypothetical protein
MKIRQCFVSNSSTSSWVLDGEGQAVVKQISTDLDGINWYDLDQKQKTELMYKWASLIQNVATDAEYDG